MKIDPRRGTRIVDPSVDGRPSPAARKGLSERSLRTLIGLAIAAMPVVTTAQPVAGWTFEVTPYLWAAGIGGDASLAGLPPVSASSSFRDLLDSLSLGAMGAIEARSGRFGVLADAFYVRLEDSFATPRPAVGPIDGRVDQWLLSAAASWRVHEAAATVDLLAGVRRTDQRLVLEAAPGVLPGATRSASLGWTDAIVGARVRVPLAADWTGMAYVDAGGGSSSTTWQAILGLERRLSDRWAVKVGYRHLGSDYERDAARFSMRTRGAFVGAGYRF